MMGWLIRIALQLVGSWLSNQQGNAIALKKYLDFINQVDLQYLKSASLRKSYEEQLKKLQEKP